MKYKNYKLKTFKKDGYYKVAAFRAGDIVAEFVIEETLKRDAVATAKFKIDRQ